VTRLKILTYPDPLLSQPCLPVTVFDDDLRTLADDLLETMRAAPGVGITAAHVGTLLCITVIELSPDDGVRIYINPEVLVSSEETMRHMEGSVSMPGFTDEVERPSQIRFRYQDLDGVAHEEDAEGFLAICIQHEIDQLDGIFWLKRLSRLKRERLVKKWEKSSRS
jgi:peptide deformylase